jgi:hypothetical protein
MLLRNGIIQFERWLGKCYVNLTWWMPRLENVLFKMLCTCSREQVGVEEGGLSKDVMACKEVSANRFSAKTTKVEMKLDEGNIEAALQVFEGIELHVVKQRLWSSISEKAHSK